MAEDRGTSGTTGVASEEPTEVDALDARIDYQRIAERSEADRNAGRVLSHTEVKRRTTEFLADLRSRRRSA